MLCTHHLDSILTLSRRKRVCIRYTSDFECVRFAAEGQRFQLGTVEDIASAREYETKLVVAAMVPSMIAGIESNAAVVAQLQQLQTGQLLLAQQLQHMQLQLQTGQQLLAQQMQTGLQQLQAEQHLLRVAIRQSAARVYNALATLQEAVLQPVCNADGDPPTDFPATRMEADNLTSRSMGVLITFLGEAPNVAALGRKQQLLRLIGCR